jgi:enoyl-[acyl-carrier-protein] reductase (NADH)
MCGAETIFFLCSDRASYITGQIVAIDEGLETTGIAH